MEDDFLVPPRYYLYLHLLDDPMLRHLFGKGSPTPPGIQFSGVLLAVGPSGMVPFPIKMRMFLSESWRFFGIDKAGAKEAFLKQERRKNKS